MGRTTDEWAALLDGTTEGPWGHCIPWGGWNPVYGATPGDEVAKVKRPADHRLASAAPEAVAEVVRLRREVSAFRDKMTKSAEREKAMYDRGRDLEHLLDAECDWEIASILNRILKGDTDD